MAGGTTGDKFIRRPFGRYVLYTAAEYIDTLLEEAVSNGIKSLHNSFPLEKVPSSRSATIYKFDYIAPNRDAYVFYYKQFHYRSAWDFIKHLFRPSRARRAMYAAEMLEHNGFSTPAVVAAGEKRRFGICLRNFLLTVEQAYARPMDGFIRNSFCSDEQRVVAEKREFVRALGHCIGRMHWANISHGDLRIGNILVVPLRHTYKFCFLDNERTVQYKRLAWKRRLRNLVDLSLRIPPMITNTDRMRFFKCYISETACDSEKLAHRVAALAAKRMQHLQARAAVKYVTK
jgi:hypothetical protein